MEKREGTGVYASIMPWRGKKIIPASQKEKKTFFSGNNLASPKEKGGEEGRLLFDPPEREGTLFNHWGHNNLLKFGGNSGVAKEKSRSGNSITTHPSIQPGKKKEEGKKVCNTAQRKRGLLIGFRWPQSSKKRRLRNLGKKREKKPEFLPQYNCYPQSECCSFGSFEKGEGPGADLFGKKEGRDRATQLRNGKRGKGGTSAVLTQPRPRQRNSASTFRVGGKKGKIAAT